MERLQEEGVDISFAEQVKGAQTQVGFIIIDQRNGERTVIWKRDEKLSYQPNEVPLQLIGQSRIFHTTTHDTSACAELAAQGKKDQVIVSIDIDNLFAGVLEIIPLVDIFIASRELPEKLLGIKDEREALREIKSRFGCSIVGMTLGEEGSLVLCEDIFIRTKGYSVPGGCKDTTGAATLSGRVDLRNIKRRESGKLSEMANAAASLKCREIGAQTSLPTFAELDAFLNLRECKI